SAWANDTKDQSPPVIRTGRVAQRRKPLPVSLHSVNSASKKLLPSNRQLVKAHPCSRAALNRTSRKVQSANVQAVSSASVRSTPVNVQSTSPRSFHCSPY